MKARSTGRQPFTRVEIVLVALVLLVAAGVRCYRIQDESLWFDEAASVRYRHAESLGEFITLERPGDPAMVPFYFTLEYYCLKLTPGMIVPCRLMSVAFGLLAIALLYFTARRLFGPWAAVIAAACAAVGIQQVYYSQEIRMYAPAVLFAMVSTHCLIRILDGEHDAWWIGYGLANAMLVWTHLYGTLLLVTQGAYVLIVFRRNPRVVWPWLAVHAPVFFSIAMWVATIDPQRIEANLSWIPSIFSEAAKQYLQDSAMKTPGATGIAESGAVAAAKVNWAGYLATLAKVIIALFWLGLTGKVSWGMFGLWRRLSGKKARLAKKKLATAGLILAWLIVPGGILLFLSLVWRPTFLPRYALHSTLALYMVMGAGIASFRSKALRIVLACLLVACYAYDTYDFGLPRRPDMRRAMALINEDQQATGARVLVRPSSHFVVAKIYSEFPLADEDMFGEVEDLVEEAARTTAAGHDCWAVIGGADAIPPDIDETLEDRGLSYEKTVIPGHFLVYLYRIPAQG